MGGDENIPRMAQTLQFKEQTCAPRTEYCHRSPAASRHRLTRFHETSLIGLIIDAIRIATPNFDDSVSCKAVINAQALNVQHSTLNVQLSPYSDFRNYGPPLDQITN